MTEHLHVHTPSPDDPPGFNYQLKELRDIVVGGFAKLDGRVNQIEGEQKVLATRVTKVEVKQEIADKVLERAADSAEKKTLDPNKVLIAIVAMVAAWVAGGAPVPGS